MRSYKRRWSFGTGWQFGKGSHVARMYRKVEEITMVSGKRWFVDHWKEKSGIPGREMESYRP